MRKPEWLLLIDKGIIILEIVLLLIFLFWRFRLGLTRYFDIDEFAHLHWGYSLYIGERPYTDFFYHFPPFFLYPTALVFLLFGRSITSLVYARIFIFAIFLLVCFLILSIVKKLRGFQTALLTVVFFAFLPLPFDKMIEIRPDLFALLFAFIGLSLFISWIEKERSKYLFWSGFSYSLSLGFVPKTVFFLIPPAVVIGYRSLKAIKSLREETGFFLLGSLFSLGILVVLLVSYGNLAISLYSIVVLTKNIHQVWASKFFIPANFSFYPNDVYYGVSGFSLPYIINLFIYLSACLYAIWKFISSLSYQDRKKCQKELVAASTFWINLGAFVYLYPVKHPQHLIFLAPFIAFYFADLLISLFTCPIPSPRGSPLQECLYRLLLLIPILIVIGFVGRQMYERKMQWGNRETLDKITKLFQTIPKDEAVFDLTGKAIFFRNGYFFCCLPYGQFIDVVLMEIPSLEDDLRRRDTKYVHTDWYDRIYGLPTSDAEYIKSNFVPYFPDGSLLIRK